METVRLRLAFDKALSESLKKTDGLKRFWVLLKPQHKTISDLSHYLLDVFDLHNACPDGLLLSMEGFFLPPFESTCVFKDRDIVRVKRKGAEISELGNGEERTNVGMLEFAGNRPLANVYVPMKLRANEEFEKETGGYESDEPEEEDDAELEDRLHVEEKTPEMKKVSKKRKASEEPGSSKKKKRNKKSSTAEKSGVGLEDTEDNAGAKKEKTSVAADKKDKKDRKSSEGTRNAKKSIEPKDCCSDHVDASCPPSETKKLPSRSARRKKAKRQWLRELRRAENKDEEEKQLSSKPNQKASQKKNHKAIEEPAVKQSHALVEEVPNEGNSKNVQVENQQPVQDSDKDVEVVPVVIRPGHIRFELLQKGNAEQPVQQNQTLLETSQWSGMSKKKGQKWGSEKTASWKWNDNGNSSHRPSEQTWKDSTKSSHKPSETWNHDANSSHKPSETQPIEEPTPIYSQIDFDKLAAYAHSPKEGDVIAYRLIQLSSSWTPELSPYLVGKISKFNPQTNKIKLVAVPKYPLIPENKLDDEESEVLPETCSLQEDGSLEMDFTSLLEVRAVNPSSTDSAKPDHVIEPSANKVQRTPENGAKTLTSGQEQREAKKNPWDEISQALSAKKAELSQEDNNWTVTESSGRNQWSFKALRGSALGPTMALLRSQNGI